MFQQLINTIKARKDAEVIVQKEKEKMEERLTPLVDVLKKITEEENQLRKEVLERLKENEETNVMIDNNSISVNTKITPKIVDMKAICCHLIDNEKRIEKEFGVKYTDLPLETKIETSFINKKEALEFMEKYKKMFEEEIPGLEEQKTEYLTITIK